MVADTAINAPNLSILDTLPMTNKPLVNRLLNATQINAGIRRLEKRIEELEEFDPTQATSLGNLEAQVHSTAIDNTLDVVFGENTPIRNRYRMASTMCTASPSIYRTISQREIVEGYYQGKERSLRLLRQSVAHLKEDLDDLDESNSTQSDPRYLDNKKVFVVHGHDETAKQEVARFLERVGLEAVILHEQVSKGMTIIEKLVENSNVGFAVVLLTPDDVGSAKGAEATSPRARQNVILELGYFLGHLGRDKVFALKKSKVEVAGDYDGVVYTDMDERGAWKMDLAGELKSAGLEFDTNALF